jgi:dienelactone hydrolase
MNTSQRAKSFLALWEKTSLDPAHLLWSLYHPEQAPLRFRARHRAEAESHQRDVRPELVRTLGFSDLPPPKKRPRLLERNDRGDYVREKILLPTSPHSAMPVYLLIPKQQNKPRPAVLALHGHGYGVKDIVGLWEDGTERNVPDGYHKDFAVALCRRGFVVAAPEIACFGERTSRFSWVRPPSPSSASTCSFAAFLAAHLGHSILGLRVQEMRRLLDYLQTRSEVAGDRLGAMGISGGGMLTLFTACTDTRLSAVVISGYFCTFRDSILALHHCPCNYVPGLARFGEMSDLAALLAPRPLLIEAGTRDPIFPLPAVRKALHALRRHYAVFEVPKDFLTTDIFEGRHQISGRKAYDFLARHLGL